MNDLNTNFITQRELADRLKITRQRLSEMEHDGLPTIRLGHQIRYAEVQVAAWLAAHTNQRQ